MKINDLRCSITLLVDVIKKKALPRSSNLKLYELEVAACLAWSFIQMRENLGLAFYAPFLSITASDSLTGKEKAATGKTSEAFVQHALSYFEEKGIDFSLGFSDKDILDFQMKKVRSTTEVVARLEKDQEDYAGSNMVLGYYLDELTPEKALQIETKFDRVRDVVICGFNKKKEEFTWYSLRDVSVKTVTPPWLLA
ncbi:hypothetical protein KBD34_05325 [Patescibacteria group bacterium]|nr:hypothetical protein [Patescibacteria group bacterium]